jgi:Flp pilus assembly pilin Flp
MQEKNIGRMFQRRHNSGELMCKCRKALCGQQVVEYAILIGIIAVTLMAMQVFAKRGLQAVIKGSADQIGPQSDSQQPMSSSAMTSASSTLTEASSRSESGQQGESRVSNFEAQDRSSGESCATSIEYSLK